MKHLIPLMMASSLLAACGSDSDSDGSSNPKLPAFSFASGQNSQVSAFSAKGHCIMSGLQQELDGLGDADYTKSGSKETWVYREGNASITFEYVDGSGQDTWKIILDGEEDGDSYNNWVVMKITQNDDGDSGSIETYYDGKTQIESRLEMSEDRLLVEEYNEDGGTSEKALILSESETKGRMLVQSGSEPFSGVTWDNDLVVTYSNCSGTFNAAETADLAVICETAQ